MSRLEDDVVQKGVEKDAFSLIKKLSRICGISFNKEEPLSYRIYALFMLLVNFYPFYQFIGAYRYLENGEEVFEFCIFEAVTTLSMHNNVSCKQDRAPLNNFINFGRSSYKEIGIIVQPLFHGSSSR